MTATKPETEDTLRAEALAIAAELRTLSKLASALDKRAARYVKAQHLPDCERPFTFAEWLQADTARGAKIHEVAKEFGETARTTSADLADTLREAQGEFSPAPPEQEPAPPAGSLKARLAVVEQAIIQLPAAAAGKRKVAAELEQEAAELERVVAECIAFKARAVEELTAPA